MQRPDPGGEAVGPGEDEHGPLLSSAAADGGVATPRLLPVLEWWDGVGVSIGVVVGSGIFASPGQMLQHVGSTGLSLLTWLLAGTLALCSSLVYAELSPMMPTAGGDRDYIQLAFGDSVSFAYSVTMFLVIKPGSLAILALTFSQYVTAALAPGLHDTGWEVKGVGMATVLLLTALNCMGVKESTAAQNALTCSKVGLLGLLLAAAGASLATEEGRKTAAENLGPASFEDSHWMGLGPAMVGALWAFDGWNDIVFMAEELRDPHHLPRIIVVSLSTCAALYMVVCVCYDAILSRHAMAASSTIALDAVGATLGPWAVIASGLLVSASVLGSMNVSVMTGGRLFFAAARSGELPAVLGTLSKSKATPVLALCAQSCAALSLLAIPGTSFNGLVAYFGSASWLWYATTGAALLHLRASQPDLHRPFRCPLPSAVLVIALALFLIASSIIDGSTRGHTLTSMAFPVAAYAGHRVHACWSSQDSAKHACPERPSPEIE
eukprot:jgi/Tetstr1/435654/TSEL_024554.t1